MKILITGAGGQLGRALLREPSLRRHDISAASRSGSGVCGESLDIRDCDQVFSVVGRLRPDVIINCAAYTAVDKCETNEQEAYSVNAAGVSYLAQAARDTGAMLVQLSTDYVFDGNKRTPYLTSDEAFPVNVYGRTKLEGERLAAKYCQRLCIARTAWLYGEGTNFVDTMLGLAESREEVRVVDDQYGSPTSASELAGMLACLIDKDARGIYHCVCDGTASRYDLTREIYRQRGIGTRVLGVSAEAYGGNVRRPMYSVLDNSQIKKLGYETVPWQDALREYLINRRKK